MRLALPILALPLLGASPAEQEIAPAPELERGEAAEFEADTCRDTVRMARSERGQPLIQRETANPDEPVLFYALDHEVDGCDVLLVSRDGDVRELPRPTAGPLLRPAQ